MTTASGKTKRAGGTRFTASQRHRSKRARKEIVCRMGTHSARITADCAARWFERAARNGTLRAHESSVRGGVGMRKDTAIGAAEAQGVSCSFDPDGAPAAVLIGNHREASSESMGEEHTWGRRESGVKHRKQPRKQQWSLHTRFPVGPPGIRLIAAPRMERLVQRVLNENTKPATAIADQLTVALLQKAAKDGNFEALQSLLKSRVVLADSITKDGITALMWSASAGRLTACALLIEEGAEVNRQKPDGASALFFAAQNGQAHIVDLLLRRGAAPNKRTKEGGTALMCAAQNGHAIVCQMLLENGADPTHELSDGADSLFLASQNGHASTARTLVAHCRADRPRHDGTTALFVACQRGHIDAVKELLAASAKDVARKDGATALFKAAQKGFKEIVDLLLDTIDAAGLGLLGNGQSPLHAAAFFGHLEIVNALLEAGANPSLRNQQGEIALDLAQAMNYDAIVRRLQQAADAMMYSRDHLRTLLE